MTAFELTSVMHGDNIRRLLSSAFILLILSVSLSAQADRKFIRQGNRNYGKGRYSESEILYRRAADKNKTSADAVFNTGDALYKQKKYSEAGEKFTENITLNEDAGKKSASWYNLGNSLLRENKIAESIEAYKNSLRLNPLSMEAKHNLAHAQDLLRQQQEEQDKQDGQQNNEGENQDQQQQNDQKDSEQNQDEGQQQQQPRPQEISPEDASRLLDALANDEKKVQEKVQQEKAARERVRTEKNW